MQDTTIFKEVTQLDYSEDFTDTMITDFTAGQENLRFTEIGPYTLNPLYSYIASYFNYIGVHESFLSKPYKVT